MYDWIRDPEICLGLTVIILLMARPRKDPAGRRSRADILGTVMGMGILAGLAAAAEVDTRLTPGLCLALAAPLLLIAGLRWPLEERRIRDAALGRLLARGVPLCLWTITIWSTLPAGDPPSAVWMERLSDPLDPVLYTHRHSLYLLLVICGLPASLLIGEIFAHLLRKQFPVEIAERAASPSPWLHWVLADARGRMGPGDLPTGYYSIGHTRWSPFGALIQLSLAIFVETALMLSMTDAPYWRLLGAPAEQQKVIFVMLFSTLILSCARTPLPAVWMLTVWTVPFFHRAYFPEALSPAALGLVILITTMLGLKEMLARGCEKLILVGSAKAYCYFIPLTGPPRFEGSGLLEAGAVGPDHHYQLLDGRAAAPPIPVPAPSWGHGLVAFGAVSALLVSDHYTRLDRALNNVTNVYCSVIALELGLPGRAEVLAAAALASDPCNTRALGVMAEIRCQQGRHEEARDWARRALRWKAHDWSTCRNVERIARLVEDHHRHSMEAWELGAEERATELARILIEAPAENFGDRVHAANEALPWARWAQRQDPQDAVAGHLLALCASRLARVRRDLDEVSMRRLRLGHLSPQETVGWQRDEALQALDVLELGADEAAIGEHLRVSLEVAGSIQDREWMRELIDRGALRAASGPMSEVRRMIFEGLMHAGFHGEAEELLATLTPPDEAERGQPCLELALESARSWLRRVREPAP